MQTNLSGGGSGSALALTPTSPLAVFRRSPGVLARGTTPFTGPGKTLHEIYSTLGASAEKHANRAAHSLGLGPAAVTERIRVFFGDGSQRESALAELRDRIPRRVQKDCGRLMKYTLPLESASTQFEAFKALVTLITRYPGLRRIFLDFESVKSTGTQENDIAALWDRHDDVCAEQWHFHRNFAAACMADPDISAMVESVPPQSLGSVLHQSAGLSLIERLVVGSECEGKSTFSRFIAIRYLGGILDLPSFWLQSGMMYRAVVQKLLVRAILLLKDLGVDSARPDESTPGVASDVEGVDILCEVLLARIQTWLPDRPSPLITGEAWYPSLYDVVQLLRQPKTEELLPRSWHVATAPKIQDLIPSRHQSRVVDTLSSIERLTDHVDSVYDEQRATLRNVRSPIQTPRKKTTQQTPNINTPRTAKILLLGSGDSGKSTILKQMRLNYGIPFSDSEIEAHRQLVFDNVTLGLNILIESLPDLELNLPDGLLPHADVIAKISNRDLRHQERFPQECLASLGALWNDATVQEAVTRGNEIALMDNLAYFFAVIPRLFSPSYVPTHQDILHVRARTIGITETTIKTPDMEMLVVDVGGAKSERRKWIHTFGDVTNIMFIASLCGYDTCLIEDRDANQDSMVLWDSICHGRWFKQTSLILCLNKNDLFEQKILDSDIAYFFPEFTGERSSAVAGRDFFKKKFRSLAHRAGRVNARDIYIHVTTATDIGLMGVLLNSFGACATST